ncbi:MAG: hypothetical protein WCS95_09750, partial [Lentisphaeria bacterium]
ASLTLGFNRLPFQGTKWTDSQEKIEISAGNLRFYAMSSSFSALSGSIFPTNQNGQTPHKPLVCLRVSSCPLVSLSVP